MIHWRYEYNISELTISFGETPLDDLDQHLIERLRDNARAPVAELARALGLSRTTVQSRLARLERSGVISGYSVKLSEAREAALIHAFVMLTVEPKQAAAVSAVASTSRTAENNLAFRWPPFSFAAPGCWRSL